MTFNVHILKASKGLIGFESKILDLITQSERMLAEHMNVAKLTTDLVIKSGSRVVQEVGIGAFCNSQYVIQMTLDVHNENLIKNFDDYFLATLGHETHHACSESTVGFGNRLFDSMILEGLACHFEVELGYKRPVYVGHLEQDERQILLNKAKLEWSNEHYNYNNWFFGNEKDNIPRWVGYDLGYYLTGIYLQEANKRASDCYDTPSSTILNVLSDRGYV